MHLDVMFRDCRLARMSDGHYCLVRDLGLVKGGKGLKHHEVVVDFSFRGIKEFSRRLIVERVRAKARSILPRHDRSEQLQVEKEISLS